MSNQGVLDAVELLKKNVTPKNLQLLQAHLQDIEYTSDFATSIKAIPDEYQKLLLKITNTEGFIEGARAAGSDMKIAQEIYECHTKSYAVLKKILG